MRLNIKAEIKVLAPDLSIDLAPEVAMDLEFFLNSMSMLQVSSLKDSNKKHKVALRFHFGDVEVRKGG